MPINQYIENINKRYKLGNATEHTFRGDLQQLIESLVPDIRVTNEPKRQKCGAPDYILTKKDIPIGFIEAKDIGDNDLEGVKKTGNKEQFDRYKASLSNLIFTDYLDFYIYRDGVLLTKIAIGELSENKIKPLTKNFDKFTNLIKDFCLHIGQTIKSPKKLAEMMAGKARLLSDIIEKSLLSDETHNEDSSLKDQLKAFKEILIHDITPKGFADVYAQTIAYGMFAARLHDPTLENFSREEAARLIPKSNPFLRKLFSYIAGIDLDDRILWIVDSLVEVFLACNVKEILKNFGKDTKTEDPIIHFYETFLSEYDPKLRKARGVWYTPAPVVNFIVRGVDEILKTEFGIKEGIADSRRRNVTSHSNSIQNASTNSESIQNNLSNHKVQILDPATGTGTFLAEAIKLIHKKYAGQEGIWNSYVENDLIPRLNGFELLMASYAMAHLQLDLLLTDTGYTPSPLKSGSISQRLRVFLTNSLEEHHPDTGSLFASWLSQEANEANQIKRDTPVMVVMGNPPYSGESANKGDWIMKLMEDYKKEPGGIEKLDERNPKWINDDYVKFIRYGQHFIEKNGSGILAFINPHGFLDNPTFRGMRWNLLKTFDTIYTIDLHGNSKKKETAPDGSIDENVFDIMQGVSINIFVKTKKTVFLSVDNKENVPLAKVYHYDLYGKREDKYEFLNKNSIRTVPYKEIPNKAPMYFMVQKDFGVEEEYNTGFKINELFMVNSVGIVTARDEFTIHKSEEDVKKTIDEFIKLDDESARARFKLGKDVRDWQVGYAKEDLKKHYPNKGHFTKINYRPFDVRWTFYTGKSKGFHCMPRGEVMQHFLKDENVGLVTIRRSRSMDDWRQVFISKNMIAGATTISSLDINYFFPLYLYKEETIGVNRCLSVVANMDKDIVNKIVSGLGLRFEHKAVAQTFLSVDNKEKPSEEPSSNIDRQECLSYCTPIDILDYIYAVLHSPSYREKYKEFLKIDFPRVPYPDTLGTSRDLSKKKFWKLVKLGGELRQIHLLESDVVHTYITSYPVSGNNHVEKIKYEKGNVYINETQYFGNVPEVAWNFYIGGYQPAQKWLKDRISKAGEQAIVRLTADDVLHYQKIIVALTETDRIMKEIDT